jgi:hypothetical protein
MRAPFSDPGGSPCPRHVGHAIAAAVFTHDVGPTMIAFEVLSRGSHARCLRFVARVAPHPRKTRYHPAG